MVLSTFPTSRIRPLPLEICPLMPELWTMRSYTSPTRLRIRLRLPLQLLLPLRIRPPFLGTLLVLVACLDPLSAFKLEFDVVFLLPRLLSANCF